MMNLVLALAVLMLASCIDGEEEVFIHADGSAKMRVQYTVPGMMLSDLEADKLVEIVDKAVREKANLSLVTNQVQSQKGQKIINIEIDAENVMELNDLLDEEETGEDGEEPTKAGKILQALLGEMQVSLDGLTAGVDRNVDLQPLFDQYLGKMGPSVLGESEFRYTVHLPKAAETTNAHQSLNEGRTLKWGFKLRETKQHPIHMQMRAPVPLPWWVFAALAVVVVLLVAGIYRLIRKS
ncbi:hypothetical protein HW115_16530 [Verrucomicrobiaceae bacterium N1E253]|uniref:DUF3153 domain-containing protein n=2 Tax=Oceaniferula marina TaxID=2748318 RepID=A0A851GQZ4_9BACT|nr:hypothetical protein [Oceaniferula marina]